VSIEDVQIIDVSTVFQSKDVTGAQYSLFLFCGGGKEGMWGERRGKDVEGTEGGEEGDEQRVAPASSSLSLSPVFARSSSRPHVVEDGLEADVVVARDVPEPQVVPRGGQEVLAPALTGEGLGGPHDLRRRVRVVEHPPADELVLVVVDLDDLRGTTKGSRDGWGGDVEKMDLRARARLSSVRARARHLPPPAPPCAGSSLYRRRTCTLLLYSSMKLPIAKRKAFCGPGRCEQARP
jgi:hypothetical protein